MVDEKSVLPGWRLRVSVRFSGDKRVNFVFIVYHFFSLNSWSIKQTVSSNIHHSHQHQWCKDSKEVLCCRDGGALIVLTREIWVQMTRSLSQSITWASHGWTGMMLPDPVVPAAYLSEANSPGGNRDSGHVHGWYTELKTENFISLATVYLVLSGFEHVPLKQTEPWCPWPNDWQLFVIPSCSPKPRKWLVFFKPLHSFHSVFWYFLVKGKCENGGGTCFHII